MLTGLVLSVILSSKTVEPAPGCRWCGSVICCGELTEDERGSGRIAFNPEPNDPPKSSGGLGTRFVISQTTAPDPSKCPEGTGAAVPNDDGTVTCFPEKG